MKDRGKSVTIYVHQKFIRLMGILEQMDHNRENFYNFPSEIPWQLDAWWRT